MKKNIIRSCRTRGLSQVDTKIGPPGHLNFKKRSVRSNSSPLVPLSAYAAKHLVDVTEVPLSCVKTKCDLRFCVYRAKRNVIHIFRSISHASFYSFTTKIFFLFYNFKFSFVNFVAPFRERDSLLMFVGNSFDVFDEILYCP